MKHIETKKGLETLLKRYQEKGVKEWGYWYGVIKGCIDEGLAMDDIDYDNTPKELRECWKGLK